MLLRLILVISLLLFMLLLISGVQMDVALYRSLLVFMGLFSVMYLSIFLLNVVRDTNTTEQVPVGGSNSNAEQEN
ncbi:MAG: hypothetical protein JJ895_08215 [Balneolaceae bacterium]|nr:hypothetical protein [Balneolaceae bacterium]